MTKKKLKVATTSLAGCFGCHMSLLDIDEKILTLLEHIEFDRTPLVDIKHISHADIGIIEGGVAHAENVEVLKEFRERCDILIAFGACAINGGIPAMRNHFEVEDCLREAYVDGIGVEHAKNKKIPDDKEIPLMLNKVHPIHEVVKVDYFLPGCPPPAEAIWTFLNELLAGKEISIPYTATHYD